MNARTLQLRKLHGLENDYVFLDAIRDPSILDGLDLASLARAVSDRATPHEGADGLIVLTPCDAGAAVSAAPPSRRDVHETGDAASYAPSPPEGEGRVRGQINPPRSGAALFDFRIFNSDGSTAQMCGNGLRCAARLALERGYASSPAFIIGTPAGPRPVAVHERSRTHDVTADMGPPTILDPITLDGAPVHRVSVGNPHAVRFVDAPPTYDELRAFFDALNPHDAFPEGVNAHLAVIEDRAHAHQLTWERGAGPTRACGTGACAVFAAGVHAGLLDPSATIHLPGGDLRLEQRADDGHLLMTGPTHDCGEFAWTAG